MVPRSSVLVQVYSFAHAFVVMKIIFFPVKGKTPLKNKNQEASSAIKTSSASASDGGKPSAAQVSLRYSSRLTGQKGGSRATCPYSVHQALTAFVVYLQALLKLMDNHVALECVNSFKRCGILDNQVE